MSGAIVEIPNLKWESQRKLDLPKGVRDAIRDELHRRWPSGTAKHAARFFDITLDRAREAANGRCSLTTLEGMLQTGGLRFALPIMEAVTGQSLARYFTELREAHDEHGRRLAAVFGGGGPVAGDRSSGHSSIGRSVARMGDAAGNRTSQRTR